MLCHENAGQIQDAKLANKSLINVASPNIWE
jgi:hypothetical protein